MTVPAHNQLSLPAPTDDPPVLRCKKCKVPLPDTIWKNCASCRRSRTESYRRWKQSASLRSMRRMDLNYSTLSQASGPTAPLDQHSNEPSHHGDPSGSSPLANDQPPVEPRRTSASTVPRPGAMEYQWSDELIEALLALPPRSRYIGKFSIIPDPKVDNSTRARMFVDQLHARAVLISDHSQPVSLNADSSNSSTLVSYCTCQEGCEGRFVVSVDDDPSHPYGVPGQRIGVVVVHPSPPD
ncbi:hypothetical protein V8E52_006973 [Russula decolorans]